MGIKINARGFVVGNNVSKNDTQDQCMKLSLGAPSTLGLVKDTAVGTCWLEVFNDCCQVYQAEGWGLGAFCIFDVDGSGKPCDHHNADLDLNIKENRERIEQGIDPVAMRRFCQQEVTSRPDTKDPV